MRFLRCIFLLLAVPTFLQAQTQRQIYKEAEKSLAEKDPQTALFILQTAYKKDSTASELKWLYAQAYYAAHNFEEAARWATKISSNAEKSALAQQLLAEAQYRTGRFEPAQLTYKLLSQNSASGSVAEAKKGMALLKFARDSVRVQERIRVQAMGKNINTGFSEFSPVLRPDTLLFTSLRFENPSDARQPQRMLSKLMLSKGTGRGQQMDKKINSDTELTAHATYSLDEERLFFNRCTYLSGLNIRCDVYMVERNNKGKWKEAKPVAELNDKLATQTQLHIGFDSVAMAERLFFVSDRKGGMGGKDIWTSVWKNKTWSPPENLKNLNTVADEQTPFFHTATQTLYFSTNGRATLGGQDVYALKWENNPLTQPQHLGKPINSGYEDLYFVMEACQCSGVLASNRPGSQYLDASNKTCCFDLYNVTFEDKKPPVWSETPAVPALVVVPPSEITTPATSPLAPINPPSTATASPTVPANTVPERPLVPPAEVVQVPSIPTRIEEFSGLTLYFDNDHPNPRSRSKSTNLTYEETFWPYFNAMPLYAERFVREGDRAEQDQSDLDFFFDRELRSNYDQLLRFEELLLARLEGGDAVKVFLKGYTSPRAQSNYNDILAARRIASIRNQFFSWNGGALKTYLLKGQLKIEELPFGETKATLGVSDDLNDQRNSVYSPAAARERRVEIVKVVVQ